LSEKFDASANTVGSAFGPASADASSLASPSVAAAGTSVVESSALEVDTADATAACAAVAAEVGREESGAVGVSSEADMTSEVWVGEVGRVS